MATTRKTPIPKNLTETLRDAINASELSFLQLEIRSGVIRQSLMKFARSESSLRLDQADKLAAHFGITHIKRDVTNQADQSSSGKGNS